jgi:uncharacterized metal-binding protein YceD (DUF177 family)
MLTVNLRHLESHAVRLEGELAAAELDFGVQDEMIRAERPLRYDLTVEKMPEALLVTGSLRMVLDCRCVRCLKAFQRPLALEDWKRHLPLTGEERLTVTNDCVDLTPFVREDMLLEFPPHPLCQPDCGGLTKGQAPKTGGQGAAASSAWAELDKLKL